MSRKGILLLNLGSPKSTAVPDVRNYLREFLNDDRVIDYPAPLRWLLLEGIILRTRPKKSAAAYASVWTPEGSPLVVTTDKLRAKLEKATGLPVAKVANWISTLIITLQGGRIAVYLMYSFVTLLVLLLVARP